MGVSGQIGSGIFSAHAEGCTATPRLNANKMLTEKTETFTK